MKNLLFVPLICVVFALSACGGKSQCDSDKSCKGESAICDSTELCTNKCGDVSAEECAGIKKVLDLYVKAAVEGDSKIARPAFAEGATISHAEGDSLICLPIQDLFDYYDKTGKQQASYEVTECSVAGDVATVRIDSKFGEALFTDMFSLVKEGSDWKIVSKIFTVKK